MSKINYSQEIEDIRNKLQINITVAIFLVVVIKAFLEKFQNPNATAVSFAFSVVAGAYMMIYGIFYLARYQLEKHKKIKTYINFLLTANFFIAGLIIIYLTNTETSGPYSIIEKLLSYIYPWMLLIIGIIIPLGVLFLMFQLIFIKKK